MAFEDELTRRERLKRSLKRTGRTAREKASKIGYIAKRKIGKQISGINRKRETRRQFKSEIEEEAEKVYKERRKEVLIERAKAKAKIKAEAPPISQQISKGVRGMAKAGMSARKSMGKTKKRMGKKSKGKARKQPPIFGSSPSFSLGSGMGLGFGSSKSKKGKKKKNDIGFKL